MPPTFRHFVGAQTDAWLPIGDHDGTNLAARLRPGLTVPQAQRQLDALLARMPPSSHRLELQILPADWMRAATPPPGFVARSPRLMLFSVMGAVGFVLLIACANVANLLLARTLGRQREIAVRGALGAGRWQLVRQFLIEALVLSCLGGLVATAMAWCGIRAIPAMVPARLVPSLLGISLPLLDLRVFAFGALAVVMAGVLSGAVPAVRASRPVAVGGLLAGGQRVSGSGQRRIRHVFQALQVALALVLLVGAGLFISSFLRMVTMPSGFDSTRLVYVEFNFPRQAFPLSEPARRSAFADELTSRVSAVPGVEAVTLGQPPVKGGFSTDRLVPDGDPARAALVRTHSFYVRPDYFHVAGIPLKAGRTFGAEDHRSAPRVVIISENAAGRLWPGRSAIGGRLDGYTVVGVIPHLKTVDFASDGVELFYPAAQHSYPPALLVRRAAGTASVAQSIRALVKAVDPRVSVQRIGTVEHLLAESDPVGSSRFYALLLGTLAALGLLTASVGLYGLISFAVGQRVHEIGVRMALGADRQRIRRLVIREALVPVALGLAAGVVIAGWLSSSLASQLFHVSPHDPATFVAIVTLVLAASAISLVVPVRRATRLDPVDALREE
jgi:predicted permease